MLLAALIVMMCATVAQHLGLTTSIASVIKKIADCPMCCSFWGCFFFLYLTDCDSFIAMGLSLLMSYLSHWFGLILFLLNKLYERVWKKVRLNRKK